MVLHRVCARRDRTRDCTDKLLHYVSYGGTHSANSQPFGSWSAEEKGTEKVKGRLTKEWVWSLSSHLSGRRTDDGRTDGRRTTALAHSV